MFWWPCRRVRCSISAGVAEHARWRRDAILAAGPDEVALIIAEPVQNAGGCLVAPPGYWQGLRGALADKHCALLMADEVICGCGRLGEWIATGREGIAPDLVSLAKGLTSAYATMGAVVAAESVVAPDRRAWRGSSVTASPSAATPPGSPRRSRSRTWRSSNATACCENVRALTPYLAETLGTLTDLPIVGDVRGDGFFWAMELVKDDGRTRPSIRPSATSCCAASCLAACARRGSSRAPTTAATRSCRSPRR